MTLDELKLEAQAQLDFLSAANQIPFQLNVHAVESIGMEEYIIRFYDNRLHSVDVSWKNHLSFGEAVSVAVLARVARLSGPLMSSPGDVLGPNTVG
jgi:hypothetical protein